MTRQRMRTLELVQRSCVCRHVIQFLSLSLVSSMSIPGLYLIKHLEWALEWL